MDFERYGTTPKGTALYYCEYNNNYHISMEWDIANNQRFYVIHHESETICYQLPETFKTAKDTEKAIKHRD